MSAENQTSSYARYRLLSSVGGKIADAVGVLITIRTLSPRDYGVIGAAMGIMAVIGFLNLTPEDVLWRDLPKLGDALGEHLSAFVWFWFVKLVVVTLVAAGACALTGWAHGSWPVAGMCFLIVVLLQVLSASTLVEVPLFAGLRQQTGAFFVLGLRVVWLALLVPNLWLHSLRYYLAALGVYACLAATTSFWLLRHKLGARARLKARAAWKIVWDAAVDLTAWLHVVGRTRFFLSRGDLAVLGALGVSLAALGGYAVAINLVGFALLLPGVLENVAAVSFAHHPERRAHTYRRFLTAAAALAGAQFLGGLFLGRTALRLLHVHDVEPVFHLFLLLLAGSSVFALGTPALAYAMCFRRMRAVLFRLFLPAAVIFAATVWVAGRSRGLIGAAVAHAIVSGATGLAMVLYVHFGRDEPLAIGPETAGAESAFQE